MYTLFQVFQGHGLRLSCWAGTQREQLDHSATDGVMRDALPESSTSPLCGPKRAAQKFREH